MIEGILTRNQTQYLHAKLDNEMVLMHVETADYFGMDPTTTHIWELLEEDMSLDHLINKLVDIYTVDYETCKNDVTPIIEDLIERKVLLTV